MIEVYISRIVWFLVSFFTDLFSASGDFYTFNLWDFLFFYACTYSLIILATYGLVTYKSSSFFALLAIESLNLPLLLLPTIMPSKAFRFFFGVQNCNYIMTIHSEVFQNLYTWWKDSSEKKKQQQQQEAEKDKTEESSNHHNHKGKKTNKKEQKIEKKKEEEQQQQKKNDHKTTNTNNNHKKNEFSSSEDLTKHHKLTSSRGKDQFWPLLKNILLFGVPNQLVDFGPKLTKRIFPTPIILLHGLICVIFGDLATFLIREWIPYHLPITQQGWAIAIFGVLWQISALEYTYWFIRMVCNAFGSPLPIEINHKNPFFSTSLGDFWSNRWNPVIAKQLQESIYKPMRQLGMHRFFGIIGVFAASAFLHAMPKYLSEPNVQEMSMMYTFFIYQGLCLMLETISQLIVYPLLKISPNENPITKSLLKRAHLNNLNEIELQQLKQLYEENAEEGRIGFYYEIIFFFVIVISLYLYLTAEKDGGLNYYFLSLEIVLLSILLPYVSKLFHKTASQQTSKSSIGKSLLFFFCAFGWVWTVGCFCFQIHNYITPLLATVSDFSAKSAFVGPLYRTSEKFYFFFS